MKLFLLYSVVSAIVLLLVLCIPHVRAQVGFSGAVLLFLVNAIVLAVMFKRR